MNIEQALNQLAESIKAEYPNCDEETYRDIIDHLQVEDSLLALVMQKAS